MLAALLAQYSSYDGGLWPGAARQVAGPAMTDKFRQAADSENFPYGADTPFIMVKSGKVTWAGRKADKIAMLKERGGKILAVWPGQWSSDVFEVNDRVRALAALGDPSARKALSTCDHTFKIREERQVTSRTRSVEVELLYGCAPDYFGPEILDVQRQLTDAFGCQVKHCGGGSTGVSGPRTYRFDVAASPGKILRTP